MKLLFFGPSGEIMVALRDAGFDVVELHKIDNISPPDAIEISKINLIVITNVSDPTTILLCKELNPNITAIVYSSEDVSDLLRSQIDFSLDPRLFSSTMLAEELYSTFS